MSKPSKWHPTLKGYVAFVWSCKASVPNGLLMAFGLTGLPSHAGAYWAQKQSTMEWELRVPYRSGYKPF